jgi:alpha-tubulin suppressor-like RCC1 family protein
MQACLDYPKRKYRDGHAKDTKTLKTQSWTCEICTGHGPFGVYNRQGLRVQTVKTMTKLTFLSLITLLVACTPTPNSETLEVGLVIASSSREVATGGVVALSAAATNTNSEILWTLEGSGKLSATKGAKVQYTAPSPIGNTSKIKITAQLAAFPDKRAATTLEIKPVLIVNGRVSLTTDAPSVLSNGQATLTAVIAGENDPVFRWRIVSGQGQLSSETGSEINFTAPVTAINTETAIEVVTPDGGIPSRVTIKTRPNLPKLAAGGYHSFAINQQGQVLGWGYNGNGELALGNATRACPAVNGPTADPTNTCAPSLIPNLETVTAIAAGTYHSLALKADGSVWAWGANNHGELGDGSLETRLSPVQVTTLTTDLQTNNGIKPLENIVAIAAGGYHSLALKNDGTVWAWGFNADGQLGNDANENETRAVQVKTLQGIVAIAGGSHHSLALKNDGTVWAWGDNADGQLGNASKTPSKLPVKTNLEKIVAIAGGGYHSLALKNDGTVWAWGYNANGELGNGQDQSSSTPQQVSTISNVQQISAGLAHSLAVKRDGKVWSWGRNSKGQLGDTGSSNHLTPVEVADGASQSAAGGSHTLLLGTTGTLSAWGYNAFGQLGNNSLNNALSPIQVLRGVANP